MSWVLDRDRSRKVVRAGVLVGARIVLSSAASSQTMTYQRDPQQTPAAFARMLIGNGTPAAPEGEIGAWLAQLNRGPDPLETEEPF